MQSILFKGPSVLLLLLASVYALAQQPPPLPNLPIYSDVSQLNASSQGELYFDSVSAGDYKLLVHPDGSLLDTRVKAQLFLPKNASAKHKVPAMVILHGSGGILPSRELAYGKLLASWGIAGLVVDTYGARGVTDATPYGLRVAIVSDADEVADAYGALRMLNRHPAINTNKIGLMGFSYGGMATRSALDKRIYDNLAQGVTPFALHLDYYGPCHFDLQTPKTTGAPLFSLRGAEDQSNDLVACANIENKLRTAGSAIGSVIYPRAAHGWEMPQPREFIATLNPAPCEQVLMDNGDWKINGVTLAVPPLKTREQKFHFRLALLGQMKKSCMSQGYAMGQDKDTHQQSNVVLKQLSKRYLLD
ncbi:dienelactone hydrolase family protein [uncultured Paraglaciecola sp.]|uniref:dienelactone hydrolase family protein n=1 Tax=uncultured Paraglaciecola sp. TaxID=1765024 RepID=UPI00261713AF|nr:dienelactone hydrolase family protein [uncultured Paraglaciecola sp.]